MKELSVEEKAKRYDEAVINGSRLWESDVITRESYEYIFPELRESEDERMRAMAIKAVYAPEAQSCIKSWGINPDDVIAWLEKQGEQKSTDKVEPKFKVGDWIVSNVSHEDYRICKILKIENGEYVIESIYGYQGHNNFETFDKDYHLWNINEAKDGDVLASELCGTIMLYKGIEDNNVQFYCDYDFSDIDVPGDRFAINNGQHYGSVDDSDDWHPATKEQRDTLEKAMADAGYQWNKEELKLNRIEQNSYWSEEDSMHLTNAILAAEKEWGIESCTSKWLKSIKERVGCEANCTITKEWKPSDEQMATFWDAICNLSQDGYKWINDMKSLYQDLKKLKEK